MHRVSHNSTSNLRRGILAFGLLFGIAACGGGGGGGGAENTPTFQGLWENEDQQSNVPVRAWVIPDSSGNGDYQAWVVNRGFSELDKLIIKAGGAIDGKRFTSINVADVPSPPPGVSGTANLFGSSESPSLSLIYTADGSLNVSTTMARDQGLTTVTPIKDFGGNWLAKYDAGKTELTWNVDTASGDLLIGSKLSSSTRGCTYTGTINPRQDSSVADVNFTESCGSGSFKVDKKFSGIATLWRQFFVVLSVSIQEDSSFIALFERPLLPPN